MSMYSRFLSLALSTIVVGATLFTAGCGDDAHRSRLRVVHASPDAPNVDVLVDGKTVVTNAPYETASAYLTVGSGTRHVEVRATGGTSDVIDAKPSFTPNAFYTILAVNTLANIEPLVLTDDNAAPPTGQIKLRLVHAAPSAGPVDIYVEAPGTDITTVSPTLTNVPFKGVSDYLTVAAGSYEVFITPTGSKTVAIDSGALTLAAGQIRTAVALDKLNGGTPLTAIVLSDLN